MPPMLTSWTPVEGVAAANQFTDWHFHHYIELLLVRVGLGQLSLSLVV